jgi:DNA-binding NarL/FixJ family response regulator
VCLVFCLCQCEGVRNAPTAIKILIADNQPLLRVGIATVIEKQPGLRLVGVASSGRETLKQLRTLRPHVALIHGRLPDMDAAELVSAIIARYPLVKTIVITDDRGDCPARRALSAGARGYLLNELSVDDLIDAIKAAQSGAKRIDPVIARELAVHSAERSLTVRELAVLTLLVKGNSNVQIATRLTLNKDTVKGHLKRIFKKLSANDRTHAALIAVRRGLASIE